VTWFELFIAGGARDWLARCHASFNRETAEYEIDGFSWELYRAAASLVGT